MIECDYHIHINALDIVRHPIAYSARVVGLGYVARERYLRQAKELEAQGHIRRARGKSDAAVLAHTTPWDYGGI